MGCIPPTAIFQNVWLTIGGQTGILFTRNAMSPPQRTFVGGGGGEGGERLFDELEPDNQPSLPALLIYGFHCDVIKF